MCGEIRRNCWNVLDGASSAGHEVEDEGDDREHEQDVDEPAERVRRNQSQKPQDEQNYEQCPKHRRTPFFRNIPATALEHSICVLGRYRVDTVGTGQSICTGAT